MSKPIVCLNPGCPSPTAKHIISAECIVLDGQNQLQTQLTGCGMSVMVTLAQLMMEIENEYGRYTVEEIIKESRERKKESEEK